MQLARAVGGDDHGRACAGPDRADLGDRHLEVREQLEQEGLELVVGAVELVDQQHDRLVGLDRLEQRARERGSGGRRGRRRRRRASAGARRAADREQLALVVPVVERLVDVDPLVALQADQARAGGRRERLRDLGLADARLALEQQRLAERERDEERRAERVVGEVALARERVAQRARRRRSAAPRDRRRVVVTGAVAGASRRTASLAARAVGRAFAPHRLCAVQIELDVNGERHQLDVDPDAAAGERAARRPRPDRHEARLRRGRLRRLRGAARGPRRQLLPARWSAPSPGGRSSRSRGSRPTG